MKLQELLQWQPGVFVQTIVVMIATVLIFGVSYPDTLTGLAYESRVFFPLPALLVARPAYDDTRFEIVCSRDQTHLCSCNRNHVTLAACWT